MENYIGTIRIRNPKTLQKWINNGEYRKRMNQGLIFNVGCGRFRIENCQCSKCRKSKNSPLKEVLEKNGLTQ